MPMNSADETAAIKLACEEALDDLTVALTQVMKAVNKMHRAVKRLDAIAPMIPGDRSEAEATHSPVIPEGTRLAPAPDTASVH